MNYLNVTFNDFIHCVFHPAANISGRLKCDQTLTLHVIVEAIINHFCVWHQIYFDFPHFEHFEDFGHVSKREASKHTRYTVKANCACSPVKEIRLD